MNLRILSTPWAIFPAAADEARRRLDPERAISTADFFTERRPLSVAGGIARIHVYGPLIDDGPPIAERLGMTDYRTLVREISSARQAGANTIILDVDSPGGMVSGLQEVVGQIVNGRETTIANCRGMACSAAYWLASTCDRIVASPSCDLGSIGVVTVWEDTSKLSERLGVQINVMSNEGADLKGMWMGDSLTDEQVAWMQERLNEIGADFRAHVEGNRPNIDPSVFRAGHYSGIRAVDLGLADALTTA